MPEENLGSPEVLPQWNCSLRSTRDKEATVGDIHELSCSGIDEVGVHANYELKEAVKEDGYILKILSVSKDQTNQKDFKVTPYKPVSGGAQFILYDQDDVPLFKSNVLPLQVTSVITNPGQVNPFLPPLPSYFPPNVFLIGALLLVVVLVILGSLIQLIREARRKTDYKNVFLRINYPDPFTDFNFEIKGLERRIGKSKTIHIEYERILKKWFYHFFGEPIFLDRMRRLVLKLRQLKVPPHRVREFYVLRKEFKLIKENKLTDEQIEQFIDYTKKLVNELKRYRRPV